MILIADGGSTKVDWVGLDKKNKLFQTQTKGLNPAVLKKEDLKFRLQENSALTTIADKVSYVYFYGAGCGTEIPCNKLKETFQTFFKNAKITVEEDMLGAVYAASGGNESIVCILGTGSNSCYFDGKNIHKNVDSLGYILMDEASGNYFGKKLIQDYYYKNMPLKIALKFEKKFNLHPDVIKQNLYQNDSPNAYLGNFATIMFDFKEEEYIIKILQNGFREFIEKRILTYRKAGEIPIYFIGSIAYYFKDILEQSMSKYGLRFASVIKKPIDNLVNYHKNRID